MNKVKVGIIGLGSWGECHLEAYRSLPHVEVAAVCEPRLDRLRQLADKYGIRHGYQNPEELLKHELDLVSIVTFEKEHLQPTLLALQSGKHVIVEKPVTTDLNEAREMWEAAKKYQRHIVPGHLLRFDPKYAEVYQTIRDGSIGKPVSIYLKRSRQNSLFATYQRTHTVYELMTHDLDQAIWYAGSRVKKVYAVGRSVSDAEVPEVLWAQLQFENGLLSVIQSNWMTPDAAGIAINDYTEIVGETGVAYFDTHLSGVQIWNQSGRKTTDLSVHHAQNGRIIGALKEQLNYLSQCILNGQTPALTSFEDAIHGVEVAYAIIRSAQTGKEVTL
jgi:UDP-N-acetylglucosamine 3-dehydrogenase